MDKNTGFLTIFRDNNTWNEKTIIGFISFFMMCFIALVDVCTAFVGNNLQIKEYIYQSFVYITIGSLGIAGLEKFSPSNVKRVEKEELED
jgi:hypothetical protein